MKNSGIEWIGEIPDSWKVVETKFLFDIFSGATPDTSVPENWDGGINWITPADFKSDDYYVSTGKKSITIKGLNSCSATIVPEDSLIFSKRAPIGAVVIAKNELCTNQGCLSCVNKGQSVTKYYYYVMRAAEKIYELYGAGTTFKEIAALKFANFVLPCPNVNEQETIQLCLSNKMEKVDKLIEVQQAQIEKLKEYKQSVITEAVTKGLNPTAPMKDSGVEWIGKIPEGWKVCRIKNLPDYSVENCFIDGDWIESPDIADSGIRYLTTGNVGDGQFKYQGNGYITQETFDKLNCKFAYPGDWVIARLNAPYGRSCILPSDEERYVLAVDIVILRTKYNKKYFCYFTQCPEFQHTVEDYARGTAMKRISRTNLGAVKTVLPSIEEQNEIADYLDNKCAKIDKLIALKQSKIEKLQEYKKSLIYEYVTGKKEVM